MMVCMCCLVEIPVAAKVRLCVECFQALAGMSITPHMRCSIHDNPIDPHKTEVKR